MSEKEFYRKWYRKPEKSAESDGPEDLWDSDLYPERGEVLKRLGELSGKTVMCLGNGEQMKEIFFGTSADVIISDIVTKGIERVRQKCPAGYSVHFCCADAVKMPLADSSVDVVYGWQMSHHLCSVDAFLSEVRRVLKDGGMGIFVDNAGSPVWHAVKWKLFRPLTEVFLKKRGVSRRDLEFSRGGDYDQARLEEQVTEAGFHSFHAERFNFISYIMLKSLRDLFRLRVSRKNRMIYPVALTLSRFDRALAAVCPAYGRNLRNMVWSFRK